MTTTDAAREWATTMQRITRHELTAEQGREVNARLRDEMGTQWPAVHAKAIAMLAVKHGA